MSQVLRDRPDVLGDLGPDSSPQSPGTAGQQRGLSQMSRTPRAQVRTPAVLKSCPGQLGPCSNGPRCGPALPGDSASGTMARAVDQLSRTTRSGLCGPGGRPALPGHTASGLMARGFFQLSRMTCAWLRGPGGYSSCPGRLGSVNEDSRGRPTLPSDSRLDARVRRVDQLSWETRARARSHTGSIDVLGNLSPDSSARGFDQLPQVTRPRV